MTTIKITELTNIGANLASTTVFPVVNMSGTPTTEKTVLGNIANVILSGAGGNYVAVGAATLAGTVTTNAQPNITSTGSLTGLTVSNAAGTVNFSNTANVTLGAVGNLHIAGGTAGQLLSTNGNGTLSWASDTTTYGNSNVVSLMAAFGSNTITTTGNVSVGNIIGNGQALTNIAGANVSGFVPNANVANTAFAVAAANVSGLGNIATINLTGSNSNVLYGNGVFAAVAGGSGNTGNVTFSDQVVMGTGSNDGTGGLYLAPGNASIANSAVQYLRVRGGDVATHIHLDTGNNAYYDQYFGADSRFVKLEANGNVVINADDYNGNGASWTLDTTGNLTLPDTTSVIANVSITLEANDTGNITGLSIIGDSNANLYAHGNVTIVSDSSNTNATWAFGNNGNLTLPGNLVIAGNANVFGTNSSLLQTTDNRPLIALSSGANGAVSSLWVEDIGNVGTSNIAAVYANPTVGSKIVRIAVGQNGGNAGPNLWDFNANGTLTFPGTPRIDTSTNNFEVQAAEAINFEANAVVNIYTDAGNNAFQWQFGDDGNLTLPGDIVGTANANFTIYSNAAAHEFIFGDDGTFYAPDNVVLGGTSIYIGPGANTLTGIEHEVFIASSNNFAYVQAVVNNVSDNGSADWVALGAKGNDTGGQASMGFTSSGFADANYTITNNGDGYLFVQSYAPGQTLLGGGGNLVLATGNQGTTKDIIFGTGGFLSSNIFGRISHANNSLELSRAGATITFPDATEQNTAWTGSVTTIANGNSNVNIATSNGNIVITSAGTNGWNFDSTGNLTIPGSSGGFIKTVANASIGIVAVDNGTNNPAQLLSMTNAGAATSIISAYATNATIQTNATGTLNTWQFDNAGNLTLPTGGQIIVSGGLVSSGASPAPTINGFSITNSVGISGNGNIAGNNISATGNVTAQGVGTNMVRRANTISGSNTAVTLDNLTALVGGTPKRLYIGAATSNMTMAGQSQTMSTGALAVSSWINVPIVTGTGNGFAMSGAITNDGDTAVLNVTDQGAGSGTWRVTGMIANTSANLYSVSIERLA